MREREREIIHGFLRCQGWKEIGFGNFYKQLRGHLLLRGSAFMQLLIQHLKGLCRHKILAIVLRMVRVFCIAVLF